MVARSENGRKLGRKPAGVYEVRFRAVQKLVVLQMDYGDIAANISEEHNVTIEQARLDIKAVYRAASADSAHERPMRAHNMRRTMQALYRRVVLAKDFKSAVSVLDRLCRLDGLYAATNVVVTDGNPVSMDLSWMEASDLKKLREQTIKAQINDGTADEPVEKKN